MIFKDARGVFFAGALYTLLALVWFWPALGSFSSALIGPPEDNMLLFWYLWHGVHSLLSDPAGFMHTTLIYYPEGVSLFYASYFYWGIFLSFFLKPFFGFVTVYNLLVLHGFVIGGIGAFCLARRWTENFWACLAAGFVFAFNLNHFGRSLHHLHLSTVYFAPFFILFFLKSLEERKFRYYSAAAFFLVIGALCDWGYLVYGVVVLAAGCVWAAWRERSAKNAALAGLSILTIAVLALAPLVVPMVKIGISRPFKINYTGHDTYVADLAGFFVPPVYHLFSKIPWIAAANAKMTGTDWEKTVYPGLVCLGLVAAVLPKIWKNHRGLFLAFLGSAVLSMGSHLHVWGRQWPLVLPNRLIEALPFFTQARNPARFSIFTMLFLSMLVAIAVEKIFFAEQARRIRKAAGLTAAALLLLDFFPTGMAVTPTALPKAYEVIRADKERDFGILEIPWEGARGQLYQTVHGIPIVQGYINRRVETTLTERLTFDPKRLGEQKKILTENRVKYIVLRKKRLDRNISGAKEVVYRRMMGAVAQAYGSEYARIYEDEADAVFKVY